MLTHAWSLLLDTAPYLFVGFVIAALLDGLLRGERWLARLSGEGFGTTCLATLIGAPLPLCSCSVLPAAITMRKRGLGRGPTLAFLVSTPETSITSVLLSYSLLGPVFAVLRPIAAVVTAIAAGVTEGLFGRNAHDATNTAASHPDDCCAHDPHQPSDTSLGARFQRGARFAFVDLFDDLFGWIIIGIFAAAALSAWVPASSLAALFDSQWLTMLVVIALGVPLYVCAEASTPIAAVFIAQGMSPGAALVFLLVGPATNLGSLGALGELFGRRSIAVYLASIITVAVLIGLGVDAFLGANAVRAVDAGAAVDPFFSPTVQVIAATAFVVLGVASLIRTRPLVIIAAALERALPFAVDTRRAAAIVAALAAMLWGSTALSVVPPGHVGLVQRFGAVIGGDHAPGLVVTWPTPIETVTVVPTARVRVVTLATHGWMLTGDENLGDIVASAHWTIAPERVRAAALSVADPDALVRSVVTTALRNRIARTPIGGALTGDRAAIESDVRRASQQHLDRYDAGISLATVSITSAHAPADVHDAFRDVAGAREDRSTTIERARAREARTLPLAHAEAAGIREAARAEAATITARARGDAIRFGLLLDAAQLAPAITRRRLQIETLETILPRWKKYFGARGDLDLWFSDAASVPPARR